MVEIDEPKLRLQRMALQRMESLQRAGVCQLPRCSTRVAQTDSVPDSSPAPVAHVQESVAPAVPAAPPVVQEVEMPKRSTTLAKTPQAQLDVIRQDVVACRRCEHLACTRSQTVFGIGTSKPRLCFFGEAPGAEEDRTGEPFVGRAGQLLTDIIEKGMKLQRSDVYILNVLKCRPPDNRAPTDEEIENCREYFERQFEVLKPEFICCLGATATKALLGPFPSLGRMRKQWFDYRGSRVMVTYHPSYLLRNPAAKKDTWEDIQMLMREMGLPIEKK